MEDTTRTQFNERPAEEVADDYSTGEGDEQKVAEKQGLISGEEDQVREGEEFPDEACLFIGDLARGLTEVNGKSLTEDPCLIDKT